MEQDELNKSIWRVISTCNSHVMLHGQEKAVCGYWIASRLDGGKGNGNASIQGIYEKGDSCSCYRCKKWLDKNFK